MNKNCVIIPVLNEEKNILKIFYKIRKIKFKFDILFVEDNSTDNTKKIIKKISHKHKFVKFIFRKNKKGIGSAHKDGIKWAYKKKYKKIITMDADGTHDPKYIPIFLKKTEKFDIVITSRFKKTNSLSDWPFQRKFLTYIRFWITKLILSMDFDASGAYRCFKTKNIPLKDLVTISADNYDYFFESIYKLYKKKYKIYEIPISLPFRKLGNSKMKLIHIVISLITIIKLKFKNN